jgi:hypothetical protein
MRLVDNFPEPVSDPEAEGLPEVADDDSRAYDDAESGREADGPDPAALPGDHSLALDRYGVTPEEARRGEPLDYKLAREDPEPAARQSITPDEGDAIETDLDRPGEDAGLGEVPATWLEHSKVSMYDVPGVELRGRPVGRLVEPDEGVHSDTEKDMVAWDAGPAGGGPSAEESAIHEVWEP